VSANLRGREGSTSIVPAGAGAVPRWAEFCPTGKRLIARKRSLKWVFEIAVFAGCPVARSHGPFEWQGYSAGRHNHLGSNGA